MTAPKLPLGIGEVTPLNVPEDFAPVPGAAQRRDDALAADLRRGMPAPLPPAGPSEGERRATAAVDEAIAEARQPRGAPCATCGGTGWVEGDGGLLGVVLCPGCGGVRASAR